jgi:hypothetical protein
MINETILYKQINKVCEIRIVDKRPTDYQYMKTYTEKRWLRKPIVYEDVFIIDNDGGYDGLYEGGSYTSIYTREDILAYKRSDGSSTYLIEENIVYYRPYVYIRFDSENVDGYCKYFDTFEEARLWTEDFVQKNKFDEKLIKL